MKNYLNVGKGSVVMGNVSGNVGDNSVVVGPTDIYGNTILNRPMAVGAGAKAGRDSIAIGAYANAGAGYEISEVFAQTETLLMQAKDENSQDGLVILRDLVKELNRPICEKQKVLNLFEKLKNVLCIVGGGLDIIQKLSHYFMYLFNK